MSGGAGRRASRRFAFGADGGGAEGETGTRIRTEQKVSLLHIELAEERIRQLERDAARYAARDGALRGHRAAGVHPLRRLLRTLR